jgi:hypothetical protein
MESSHPPIPFDQQRLVALNRLCSARVFGYRAVERSVVEARRGLRVLDVGCGRSDNLARLALQSRWEGDDVLNRFRYAGLLRTVLRQRRAAPLDSRSSAIRSRVAP